MASAGQREADEAEPALTPRARPDGSDGYRTIAAALEAARDERGTVRVMVDAGRSESVSGAGGNRDGH